MNKLLSFRLKRWTLIFGAGVVLGILIGSYISVISVINDCRVMGMFRVGDAPFSCTSHLVHIPVDKPQTEDKKKK